MDIYCRTVDELARELPGAAEVFHRHHIDVCTSGPVSARRAAMARGVDPRVLAAELEELTPKECVPPSEPDSLIDHILERYHQTHLREFPEAIRLARLVEIAHRHNDACPHGLADHLEMMAEELEHHQQKEEAVLFPLMRAGGGPMLRFPITRMNAEHREVDRQLATLAGLTNRLTAPANACGTWGALYSLCRKLDLDLREHMRIETEVLFPMFDAAES